MSRAPFVQFFPADLLSGTLHLTTEQVGAYMLLFFAMWTAGGSLPNQPEKLARIARVSRQKWERIGPDVLEFFQIDGEEITQGRLRRDIEKVYAIVEKRSAAGKRGNEVKSLKSQQATNANAIANHERSERISQPEPKPDLETEEKKEGRETVSLPMSLPAVKPVKAQRNKKQTISSATIEPDFQEFMRSYPKPIDEDAARRAYRSAIREGRGTPCEILAGTMRYAALQRGVEPRFIKAPQNWLAAGSWKNPQAKPSTTVGMSNAHGMPDDPTIAGFNRRLPA